jgi:FkbM family methyltransferase
MDQRMYRVTAWAVRLQVVLLIPFQWWWWKELLRNLLAIIVHHPRQFALLVRAWLGMALQKFSRRTRRRSFTVPVTSFGRNIQITVADPSEVFTLLEVFVLGDYELPFKEPIRTIVDAGAHVGSSVLWFATRYPGARIVAVEPHPDTFTRLCKNTQELTNVELVAAALHTENGDVKLFHGNYSWNSSLVPAKGLQSCQKVQSFTLDRIAHDYNLEQIDILKLDIEGSEAAVLRSTGVLDRVRTIVFEYHAKLADMPLDELLDNLTGFEVRCMQRLFPGYVVVIAERASSEELVTRTPPLDTG